MDMAFITGSMLMQSQLTSSFTAAERSMLESVSKCGNEGSDGARLDNQKASQGAVWLSLILYRKTMSWRMTLLMFDPSRWIKQYEAKF